MLEPWNNASILPPPVNTFFSNINVDISKLNDTCNRIMRVLSKQSPLHKESAILSRFVYKYDKKFRNDIGYRNFRKVNTSLRKFIMLNLIKDIENFLSVLPSKKEDVYLPTRQMLEYILVRLLTFSKLTLRISICSKQAAIFYLDRIKRGESHWMSLMPYALLSRVWSISNVLLHHSVSWYSQLYQFLDKLQLKGLRFLPNNYTLPSDIEEWLEMKNVEDFGRYEWTQKKHVHIDPNLEDDEEDAFQSILNYVTEVNHEKQEPFKQVESNLFPNSNDEIQAPTIKEIDQGETISRNSLKTLLDSPLISKYTKEKKYCHSPQNVTNNNSLQEFITNEETFRNEASDRSLTSHLSFMQWQTLKKYLLKLNDPLYNHWKIERKFQKIWKEKCLDYI